MLSVASDHHPVSSWYSKGRGGAELGRSVWCVGSVVPAQAYRNKKIKEQIVVSSEKHPQYKAWASDSQTQTPMYYDYTLYNITNPTQFLAGASCRGACLLSLVIVANRCQCC